MISAFTKWSYCFWLCSIYNLLQPSITAFCAIIQLTANNSALDMTGLLSDLEPRRGNWVEFQPGMLSCRHRAQKFIFACGSRAAHENTVSLSTHWFCPVSQMNYPVLWETYWFLTLKSEKVAKNSMKVMEQTLTKVFLFSEFLYHRITESFFKNIKSKHCNYFINYFVSSLF